jgi:mannose-6-phosphate isomerase-like protein (cupin superfamily)
MSRHVLPYKMALASLASDERYSEMLTRGSASAGIYAPHETDDQEPHDQDEFYVVLNGSGFFTVEGEREPFGPGDLVFVPAGVDHRFEDFTPDFAVWAIFCDTGDEAGERGETSE